MRKSEPEIWILIGCGIAFALFMLYVLTGCSTLVRQQKSTMTYSDGCYLRIETFSNTESKAVDKDWGMENKCNVDLDVGVNDD